MEVDMLTLLTLTLVRLVLPVMVMLVFGTWLQRAERRMEAAR